MERVNYYNPNIKFNRKALTEVYEILKAYEEDTDEIPEKYMWVIEDNMDKDYIFIVDDLDIASLREDTKEIITYLYTNFLSNEKERIVLKQLEKIQYKEKFNRDIVKKRQEEKTIFNNIRTEKPAPYDRNIEEKVCFEKENIKQNIEENRLEESDKRNIIENTLEKSNEQNIASTLEEEKIIPPMEYKESVFHNILNKIKAFFGKMFRKGNVE